jgi:hypothetical protein
MGAAGCGALLGHCSRGAVTFGLAQEIVDVAHADVVLKRGVHREPTVGVPRRDEKARWLIGPERSDMEPERARGQAGA